MADNNFEIRGQQFKVGKINAMKQYHIVRRIAPILGEMLPAMKDIAKKKIDNLTEEEQLDQAAKIAGPVMTGLSKLNDKDSEFVLFSLLAAVEINQGTNWARLVVNDQLMFQDLELPILLQAAGRSFMYNMTGFFGVLQQGS
jgi:hypothetical protein